MTPVTTLVARRYALASIAGSVLFAGCLLAPRITLTPPITSSLPLSSSASAANIQNQEFSQPSELQTRRDDSIRRSAVEAFGRLPLRFEENRGQANGAVRYLARAPGYNLFLTAAQAVMVFPSGQVLRLSLTGGQTGGQPRGLDPLPGTTNYIGADGFESPGRHSGITSFRKVRYQQVYPGIDQVFYGSQTLPEFDLPEFDLEVAPGADPGRIRMQIDGARSVRLLAGGDLSLVVDGLDLRMSRPIAYQEIDGERREVECRYVAIGRNQVRLELGAYDNSQKLVIDPVLQYATYVGGGAGDAVLDLAVDASGHAYLTGWTLSADYPVTAGAFQSGNGGAGRTVFVSRLDPNGTALVYSTYIGPVDSKAHSIAIDQSGNAYLTGSTTSASFPTTEGAMQPQPIGRPGWAFVTKLDPTGSNLVYSTFVTGLTGVTTTGIAVDSTGAAFITGQAGDGFQTSTNAFQETFKGGQADGFVARLDPNGAQFDYATYIGGSYFDLGQSIVVDGQGQAYVTGVTTRAVSTVIGGIGMEPTEQIPFSDFPVTRGAFQTIPRGRSDIFVAKFRADGTGLLYSTLLGGSGEEMTATTEGAEEPLTGRKIAIDSLGNAYLTGTTSSTDFPTSTGAFQRTFQGGSDVFVTRLNVTGSRLLYSTLLGGTDREIGNALAIDSLGAAYVTGSTLSTNFPITADGFRRKTSGIAGLSTAYVTKVDAAGATLDYSTYLGGSGGEMATSLAVNPAGSAIVGGFTRSIDFPTTTGSHRPQPAGEQDGFVVKVVPGGGLLELSRILPATGGDGGTVWAVLYGLQFRDGLSVKLTRQGESDIIGTSVSVGSDGRSIGVVFNLSGLSVKARGGWDVVVTNPNGTSATLRQGFVVEAARESSIEVDANFGPASIRAGQRHIYVVSYRNTGNNDAYGVPIWIKARGGVTLRLVSELAMPVAIPGEAVIDWTQVPTYLNTPDGGQMIPVVPAVIPPGRVGYIGVELMTPSTTSAPIPFEAWTSAPIFASADGSPVKFNECYRSTIKGVGVQVGVTIQNSCEADLMLHWQTLLSSAVRQSFQSAASSARLGRVLSLAHLVTALSATATRCAGSTVPIGQINGGIARALGIRDELRNCLVSRPGYDYRLVPIARNYDPYFNIGKKGAGRDRHIDASQLLLYSIGFENSPVAKSDVRQVIITDQLDPATTDLNSFSFGPVVIGSQVYIPPAGVQELVAEIDFRPGRSMLVRVLADLKRETGLVTWRFLSIDPATGQAPTDIASGFLPPNSTSPQGAGAVVYSVLPRLRLASGTVLGNQPSIVLDQAAPIRPGTWANRLDTVKPASRVENLPPVQQTASFQVKWGGTDADSGIESYNVYVAVDQGPYQLWQTATTATSATYNGLLGRKYSFYSTARDLTGNVEDPPTVANSTGSEISPDTTTIIQNFDLGMQDDRTGDFVLFSSFNGEYYLTHCGMDSFTASGKGTISRNGAIVTLTNSLLSAKIERRAVGSSQFSGEARFRQSTMGITYSIVDRSATNNTWRCSQ